MTKYCKECDNCWLYLCEDESFQYGCKNCGYTQSPSVYDKKTIIDSDFKKAFLLWLKITKNANVGLMEGRSSYSINGCICHLHFSRNYRKEHQMYWTKIPALDAQEYSITDEKKHFLILITDYTMKDTYIINNDRIMITGGKDGWIWEPDSQGYYHLIIDKFDNLRLGGHKYPLKEFKNAYNLITS